MCRDRGRRSPHRTPPTFGQYRVFVTVRKCRKAKIVRLYAVNMQRIH
jgi:hypothetical protein